MLDEYLWTLSLRATLLGRGGMGGIESGAQAWRQRKISFRMSG
jgi:hypothetical protein